ncbi:AraC family transcriptional regulator [Desulfoscipio sp. XC116]|uniref:AraC family transcriptional regulator n=1 Tax=Desulfoscipio sp. XC116 TaxID=3144975 RepID=UPI00325A82D8
MSYKRDMERCRDYIETHIREDITPRGLAKLLGYSFYHFCHVFRICNDMPVGVYLRRRRLQRALDTLGQGARITDIALDFGFETPSGFAKAFQKEFGMSASAYRKMLLQQNEFDTKGGMVMNVQFKRKDGFKAVGYSIAPEDRKVAKEAKLSDLGAYWLYADFSSVSQEEYAGLAKSEDADQIGMWFQPEQENDDLRYFLGLVVEDFAYVPRGMAPLEIPAADYAVFTTDPADLANDKPAFGKEIQKTWKYIFEEWFEQSGYAFDQDKSAFEFYCSANGNIDSTNAVAEIYIPIKKL